MVGTCRSLVRHDGLRDRSLGAGAGLQILTLRLVQLLAAARLPESASRDPLGVEQSLREALAVRCGFVA